MNGAPRKPKRKRRADLSIEVITEAAVQIADEKGLPAVTIRRVAESLDARPMTLYDYIESKDQLLALMGDSVAGEVLIEPDALPRHWREALTMIAKRVYVMLVKHPWLVEVSRQQYRRLGPNAQKSAKQLAASMAELDIDEGSQWTLVGTMNDFVVGHSSRVIASPQPEEMTEVIPDEDLNDAPELASLPDWIRTRTAVARFEAGLKIVLDGIEREVLDQSE